MHLKDWLVDFLHLFFPPRCIVCGRSLAPAEQYMCIYCRADFPYYGVVSIPHKWRDLVLVEHLYALFEYEHGSPYRRLVHVLKYNRRRDVGVFLGRLLAEEYLRGCDFDCLVPVPLHPKREVKRGYNQSRVIAEGIQQVLSLPIEDGVLLRVVNNPSQTKLKKRERADNVQQIFRVVDTERLAGKHVLLVDDVVTSGATIRECLLQLRTIPDVRVSVACLGRAGHA